METSPLLSVTVKAVKALKTVIMKFHYENLRIVLIIHEWVQDIYRISQGFPREELYGLTSQIRRAATSVLLNLAEGSARKSPKEYARFLNISIGSLVEVDACLKIAKSLNYLESFKDTILLDRMIEKIYFSLVAIRKTLSHQE